MTCIGTRTKVWAYKYDADYMTQFWPPGDGLSRMSEYVDYSTHGREILKMLEYIKKHPVPDEIMFENPLRGRPTRRSLRIGTTAKSNLSTRHRHSHNLRTRHLAGQTCLCRAILQ